MKRAVLVVVALCLAACGGSDGPDFTGAYTGSLVFTGACSDGSTTSQPATGQWNLTEHGGATLDISTNGACGLLSATIGGNIATIQSHTCTPVVTSSGTTTITVNGGTATLSGRALAVHMPATATISGPTISGSCTGAYDGTLNKQ